jgi:hypothetical protein
MIRDFDYRWGIGIFPRLEKGWGCAAIPRHPSIKSKKKDDPLCSKLREEGETHTCLVPIVERSCSWTNAKRVWIKHRSNQDSTPAVGIFIRRWALNLGRNVGG